ncbi:MULTISPECIES: coiled-coil domain-containing protein [unclassified Nonomuraea]|uniref:coiled-coil domain-containing protein n=1 Tax=unclassified Nonomuraea TaxID=2593643 RepID=UPI0035BFB1A3
MRIWRLAVLVAVLAGLVALPTPPPAAADPSPAELRRLTKQAERLEELYRGQIQSLEDIKLQAKKATDTSGNLEAQLRAAQAEVTRIAQTSYMVGPIDGMQLLAPSTDPYKMLGQAANMTYMANERAKRVESIKKLIDKSKDAKVNASEKIEKLRKEIKVMQGKRDEIEKLLNKYGFQQPGGSEGLTPRMISVRAEIMRNFPMRYGVGCLRPGDPGEHGKGRACDFMMSRGGTVAGGADAANGDALAAWLIKNGPRLGVMYIIWKQRYYDIRSGGGWDPMSNRGGATANHYDHVHVSVF